MKRLVLIPILLLSVFFVSCKEAEQILDLPEAAITFDANGGLFADGSSSITLKGIPGDPVVAPEAPSRENFLFADYDLPLPESFPTKDMKLTAVWAYDFSKLTDLSIFVNKTVDIALPQGVTPTLEAVKGTGEVEVSFSAEKATISVKGIKTGDAKVLLTIGNEKKEISVTVKDYDKYVIIGVWGQSNAVGYDESPLEDADKELSPRLMQWGYNDNKLTQLTHCAKNAQDMSVSSSFRMHDANSPEHWGGTKGIHLPLAQLIATIIPDDYGVIIVPAAFGGKRISECVSQLQPTFVKNLKAALELNSENKLYGIIWCQGEFDASKNMSGAEYKTAFENMINTVNSQLSSYASQAVKGKIDKSIWYNWEFPIYYKNTGTGRDILKAQKDVLGDRNYVAIPDETLANPTTYTSGTKEAHFGQGTFRSVIAPAVFAKMKANILGE